MKLLREYISTLLLEQAAASKRMSHDIPIPEDFVSEIRRHIRTILSEDHVHDTKRELANFRHKGDSYHFRVTLPGVGYIEAIQKLDIKQCQSDVDVLMASPEYLAAEKKYEESNPPRTSILRNEKTGKYEVIEIGPSEMIPKFYVIDKAFIHNPESRGKGYGKALYKEAIKKAAEYAGSSGGVFVAPLQCSLGVGSTSPEARRVWNSLSRDYLSSGHVIFVRTN